MQTRNPWLPVSVLLAIALVLVAARPAGPAAFAVGEGGVSRVVIYFEDGSQQVLYAGVVATPTVQPSHTPDPTPTASPTLTALPTNTPRPASVTPTQEVTVIPTLPTSEPPDDSLCMAGVMASTLNVRAEPMISGAKVGQLAQSTRVQVTALKITHGEGTHQPRGMGAHLYGLDRAVVCGGRTGAAGRQRAVLGAANGTGDGAAMACRAEREPGGDGADV